jgi:Protein of unknown function (DUF1524)
MQKTKSTHSSIASFKFFISSATASVLLLVGFAVSPLSAEATATSQTAHSAVQPTAISALGKLKVRGQSSHDGYARSAFSDGWGDLGSCDLRNYILQRDLTKITWRSGETCIVASGTLKDPYTGKVINFVRGVSTSLAVQIDHVVALSNAWSTGASSMSAYVRYKIYNDPLNLLAVDGPTNGQKSDSDAASWLPPNRSYRCAYVSRQIAVKSKYRLWVTGAEKTAMLGVLKTCPAFKIPAN